MGYPVTARFQVCVLRDGQWQHQSWYRRHREAVDAARNAAARGRTQAYCWDWRVQWGTAFDGTGDLVPGEIAGLTTAPEIAMDDVVTTVQMTDLWSPLASR